MPADWRFPLRSRFLPPSRVPLRHPDALTDVSQCQSRCLNLLRDESPEASTVVRRRRILLPDDCPEAWTVVNRSLNRCLDGLTEVLKVANRCPGARRFPNRYPDGLKAATQCQTHRPDDSKDARRCLTRCRDVLKAAKRSRHPDWGAQQDVHRRPRDD